MTILKPDTRNANKGTARGRELLVKSLRELGAGRSVLADKDGNLIAGNKTFNAANELGLPVRVIETDGNELVVVKRNDLDLNEKTGKARQLAYADNRVAEIDLAWEAEMLSEDMAAGLDLTALGFTEKELKDMEVGLGFGEQDAEPQLDKAEELREKWGVQVGDLWQLGEHRLICGDCTDIAVVERVMAGAKTDLVLTDPPYAVNYGEKNRALNSIGPSNRITDDIENDNLSVEETAEKCWAPAFENAYNVSRNGTVIYCFSPQGGDQMMMMMMMMMMKAKWNERLHQLVWMKNSPTFSMGRLDYQYQHEPILYSWRGTNHAFYGGTGKSIIECDRPRASKLHPTMKPVELFEILIQNSSQPNEVIYEPFSGSGTNIIACENLKRKCRAAELSPEYVAVTLQRYLDATGIEPVRLA